MKLKSNINFPIYIIGKVPTLNYLHLFSANKIEKENFFACKKKNIYIFRIQLGFSSHDKKTLCKKAGYFRNFFIIICPFILL